MWQERHIRESEGVVVLPGEVTEASVGRAAFGLSSEAEEPGGGRGEDGAGRDASSSRGVRPG